MKFVSKMLMCAVLAAVATQAVPANAGDRSYNDDLSCNVKFGFIWPQTLALVQLDLGQIYHTTVSTSGKLTGKIYFVARDNSKKYDLKRGDKYVITVTCGDVSKPKRVK